MTLIARKDFPPKDVKELIAYLKANKTRLMTLRPSASSTKCR